MTWHELTDLKFNLNKKFWNDLMSCGLFEQNCNCGSPSLKSYAFEKEFLSIWKLFFTCKCLCFKILKGLSWNVESARWQCFLKIWIVSNSQDIMYILRLKVLKVVWWCQVVIWSCLQYPLVSTGDTVARLLLKLSLQELGTV